jgi:hypothetical protein
LQLIIFKKKIMADDTVVVGFPRGDFANLSVTANNIMEDGVFDHVDIFTTPVPDKTTYKAKLDLFNAAQSSVIDKTAGKPGTLLRDKYAGELYDLIEFDLVPYLNKNFRGKPEILSQSGLPLMATKEKHPLPDIPSISKVIDGPAAGSVRAQVKRKKGVVAKRKRERIMWRLYMASDPAKRENYTCICETTNSNKLIGDKLTHGDDLWFALTAANAAGETELSPSVKKQIN